MLRFLKGELYLGHHLVVLLKDLFLAPSGVSILEGGVSHLWMSTIICCMATCLEYFPRQEIQEWVFLDKKKWKMDQERDGYQVCVAKKSVLLQVLMQWPMLVSTWFISFLFKNLKIEFDSYFGRPWRTWLTYVAYSWLRWGPLPFTINIGWRFLLVPPSTWHSPTHSERIRAEWSEFGRNVMSVRTHPNSTRTGNHSDQIPTKFRPVRAESLGSAQIPILADSHSGSDYINTCIIL